MKNQRNSPDMLYTDETAFQSIGDAADFRRRLKRWFKQHGRSLPWRETRDPYRIWISEIMLQQTQVATVVDYFHRFLGRFPTITSLAAAAEQDVLAMWSGLGYYRRARQLHAAAKKVVDEHDGQFPTELATVLALPGVGRYTAGAITSFAFDARSPIVEANTIRLYSRLLALEAVPTTSAAQRQLWAFAENVLPPRGKGSAEINQALMELGSLVCKPTNPRCDTCPVVEHCAAHKLGIQERLPASKPKTAAEPRAHVCVLLEHNGRYLLRQNLSGEWWEGLWDFPRCDITPQLHAASAPLDRPPPAETVQTLLADEFNLDCDVQTFCRTLRHGVTRFKIALHCYRADPAISPAVSSTGPNRKITQNSISASREANANSTMRVAESGPGGCAGSGPDESPGKASAPIDESWQWVALDGMSLPLTSTAQKLRRLVLADRQGASQPRLF